MKSKTSNVIDMMRAARIDVPYGHHDPPPHVPKDSEKNEKDKDPTEDKK